MSPAAAWLFRRSYGNIAGGYFSSWRAITIRWIWLVPS